MAEKKKKKKSTLQGLNGLGVTLPDDSQSSRPSTDPF